MTNVELYEALKGSISDKAARLIAEAFPAAKDLATKSYIDEKFAEVGLKFADVDLKFAHVDRQFAELRAEIQAEARNAMRRTLGLFIPMWAATMGTLIVALVKL